MKVKVCTNCQRTLPATHEFYQRASNGILNAQCKDCTKKALVGVVQQNKGSTRPPSDAHLQFAETFKKSEAKVKHDSHGVERRARILSLREDFTDDDWRLALSYFHNSCAVCGSKERTLAPDHWIPLAHPDCIGTTITNMIPLCCGPGGCNNIKQSQHPKQFLSSRYPPEKVKEIMDAVEKYFYLVDETE